MIGASIFAVGRRTRGAPSALVAAVALAAGCGGDGDGGAGALGENAPEDLADLVGETRGGAESDDEATAEDPSAGSPETAGGPASDEAAPEGDRPDSGPPASEDDGGPSEIELDDDFHLDDLPPAETPGRPPEASPETAPGATTSATTGAGPAPISLVLRSTPPGARVFVDGEPAGVTPIYWNAEASGDARDFTFVREGYELARYRFVPLQDGVVHADLEALAGSAGDVVELPGSGGAAGDAPELPGSDGEVGAPPGAD